MLGIRINRWFELDDTAKQKVLNRPNPKNNAELPDQVTAVIKAVRNTGDKALKFYTQKFDNIDTNELVLTLSHQQQAIFKLAEDRKKAIELAYQNIRKFHAAQEPKDLLIETMPGVVCELKHAPLSSVS